MHPIISQALAAERVREWRDLAAQDRLANEALRARRRPAPAGAKAPQLRGRLRASSTRQAVLLAVPCEHSAAEDAGIPPGRHAA